LFIYNQSIRNIKAVENKSQDLTIRRYSYDAFAKRMKTLDVFITTIVRIDSRIRGNAISAIFNVCLTAWHIDENENFGDERFWKKKK